MIIHVNGININQPVNKWLNSVGRDSFLIPWSCLLNKVVFFSFVGVFLSKPASFYMNKVRTIR